jgi:hypothetical protein
MSEIEVFINDVDMALAEEHPRMVMIEKFRAAGVKIPNRLWMAIPDDYSSNEWDLLLRNTIHENGVKTIKVDEDLRGKRFTFFY